MSTNTIRCGALFVWSLAFAGCPGPVQTDPAQVVDREPDREPEEDSFDFELSGEQEAPPVDTNATGEGAATLEENTLTVEGSFEGLSSDLEEVEGSPAHIHVAPIGESGPIVFNLEVRPGADNRSGTFEGTFDLTDEQRRDFEDGLYYVNVHTELYPAGEVRGQLVEEDVDVDDPDPAVTRFDVELRGEQEVPPVDTEARGESVASLEDNTLTVEGSFERLSSELVEIGGSAAHIHVAPIGESGPVVFSLEVRADADNRSGTFEGTFELTEEQVQDFEEGRYYVNVHTERFPAGELRGQLVRERVDVEPVADVTRFDFGLSGEQEVPPADTGATGAGVVTFGGHTMTLAGTFEGLSSDLVEIEGSPAHVHVAPPGESGPIVFNVGVIPEEDLRSGDFIATVELTEEQVRVFEDGHYYLNIHSEQFPAGELRGQLVPR